MFVHSLPRRSAINLQTFLVLGSALACSVAAVRYQAFERFCELARRFEAHQVDEMFISALIFSAAFFYLFLTREMQVRHYIAAVEAERVSAVSAAYQDDLTGLPNRRAFADRLASLRCGADRDVALLMLDLDGFKAVNDTLGHAMGDNVLRCVASRLKALVDKTPGMFAARLGGDEFACVVVSMADQDAPNRIADEIVNSVGAPMFEAPGVAVGVSVGIAANISGSTVDGMLRQADAAMYFAKRTGGRCYIEAPADGARPNLHLVTATA